MAADPMDPMTQAFKLRFEFARNHTLGNLMLSALEEVTGSFPEAIRICSDILGARGEVYPSTLNNITLFARTVQGAELRGQVNCGHSLAPLESVWLGQPDACVPYEAALDAVRNADLIVLGPGSLFTSIMPNLLVPGIREAIRDSYARTVFVCGLADVQGETKGMNVRQHVEALLRHGMKGLLDYVLVQDPTVTAALPGGHPVAMSAEDRAAIEAQGVRVVLRNLVDPEHPTWHYP
jgi:uncharacterized cofD-like protein